MIEYLKERDVERPFLFFTDYNLKPHNARSYKNFLSLYLTQPGREMPGGLKAFIVFPS